MDTAQWQCDGECRWRLAPTGAMRVPAILYADETLLRDMDEKVGEQLRNVASLPGIVGAAYALPDAHWGYGFPIGGVAAFDPDAGGVVSAGGVGFDISCGVRTLRTGLARTAVVARQAELANELARQIPAGLGSTGRLRLSDEEFDAMLTGGARWAVERGYGTAADLEYVEEYGQVQHAEPAAISAFARRRQRDEMGTLGSGNHYLEVQYVVELCDAGLATCYGLAVDDVVMSIHCGSRGLGHQVGTEYLREMLLQAPSHGLRLPDRELACAPVRSELGARYLGAMRAATNCALANRQILTQLARDSFARLLPGAVLEVLYDVSHNICKEEVHRCDGGERPLFVHRKGATRAFGPNHPAVPPRYRAAGQPVLIGGSMGTASYSSAARARAGSRRRRPAPTRTWTRSCAWRSGQVSCAGSRGSNR